MIRASAALLLGACLCSSHLVLAQQSPAANAPEAKASAEKKPTSDKEQPKELNAEGMTIYGQRELPKVLYIVPWKKMKSGDIEMPVTESLVSDVLDPIDPEVFRRQIKYYDAIHKDDKSK